ncbi:hypothetical protein IQ07DRAFT_631168 [Pyrenochaeta sp. DS3sAY3a]|nr:hypothetical protein IQ07DRAFT_631168 [Pyrenochaeta sp. DS3sAY3a]
MDPLKATPPPAYPIRELSQECRSKLHACRSIAILTEQHWADNRLSDFNLWDAGIGASAKDAMSLDRRLCHDMSARDVVAGTLITLAAWMATCIEIATLPGQHAEPSHQPELSFLVGEADKEPDSDDEDEDITVKEAKSSIEQMLRVLVSLGLAIRKAGKASRLRRADKTFNEQDPQCQELIASLTSYIQFLSRLRSIPRISIVDERGQVHDQLDLAANWATKVEKDSIKTLRPEQRILLISAAKRFWRFHEAKKRREGFQVVVPDTNEASLVPPSMREQPQVRSVHPKHIVEETSSRDIVNPVPPYSLISVATTNQVSAFEPDKPLRTGFQGPATATSIARRVQHPDPPRLAKDSSVFVCPFCHLTLPRDMAERAHWKHHLSEDLQPYTCYYPDCPDNNPFFETFQSWNIHTKSDHRVFEGWTCAICGKPFKSTEESQFDEHILQRHPTTVAPERLGGFKTACSIYVNNRIDSCPICSIHGNNWRAQKDANYEFEPDNASFAKHIASCMYDLSLRSLPLDGHGNFSDAVSQASASGSKADSRSNPSGSFTFSRCDEVRPGLDLLDKTDSTRSFDTEGIKQWIRLMQEGVYVVGEERDIDPLVQVQSGGKSVIRDHPIDVRPPAKMSMSELKLPQSVYGLPFDICRERRELDQEASKRFTRAWNIFGQSKDKDLARTSYFSKRHFIFVLDNSETMSQHWPLVTFVAETLAKGATGRDTEGLDIWFHGQNSTHRITDLKGDFGSGLLRRALIEAFPHSSASDSVKTNLPIVFYDIIARWQSSGKRTTTLMVFTDGTWLGKYRTTFIESLLDVVAKEQKARGERIFTIQFIRFGDSALERDRLQDLAEDCYYLTDIIDHCSWRATVERMFIGAIDYLGELRRQKETENSYDYEALLELFKNFNEGEGDQGQRRSTAKFDLLERRRSFLSKLD